MRWLCRCYVVVMAFDVRLFPGFPLPAHDHAELMAGLARYEGSLRGMVVAHSLGALEALSLDLDEDVPMVLLAPSTLEKGRRGRGITRGRLRALERVPAAAAGTARVLRERT